MGRTLIEVCVQEAVVLRIAAIDMFVPEISLLSRKMEPCYTMDALAGAGVGGDVITTTARVVTPGRDNRGQSGGEDADDVNQFAATGSALAFGKLVVVRAATPHVDLRPCKG